VKESVFGSLQLTTRYVMEGMVQVRHERTETGYSRIQKSLNWLRMASPEIAHMIREKSIVRGMEEAMTV
jgi:hypothetical protein